MTPEIIVMLTHNDVTVPDARACFQSAADLPVQYWGFKDVGLETAEMEALVADLKAAGKTAVLEIVNFDESETLEAASLAAACGVDYFTGARFSEAVRERVHGAGMKYFPFSGDVGGHPIELRGTIEDVIADSRRLCEAGADGIDLVAYRYLAGDPVVLAEAVAAELGGPRLIVAGSINSLDRVERMHQVGPFAYTMGGVLFDGAFRPGGSFRDNLEYVVDAQLALSGARR
jgi:thiamine monophosphate synthase